MTTPTRFEYQIVDDQGLTNASSIPVSYDGATETEASLEGAWAAYGALVDACVDGKIVGGQILIPLAPATGWKTAAVNGNNVNQVMNLNFNNDFDLYATSILLPSYKEALLNTTLPKAPNLAQTNLAAFIAAIIAGSGAVFPNSLSSHDLNALRDAFLTVRKVRNQRRTTIVRPA